MMRPRIVRLVAAAATFTGVTLAFAYSGGPPVSYTGAPAIGGVPAERVCTRCHTTFPLNQPGATLTIEAPELYVPWAICTLRVRMSSTFPLPRRWGFEMTAVRASDGQGAGVFDATGFDGVQGGVGAGDFASRFYIEHTSAGTYPNHPGPVEWAFLWQAPGPDAGRVLLFCAGNAANNSGTNSGDHIYTARDTIEESGAVGVPVAAHPVDALEPARPNPFAELTTLGFSRRVAGAMELAVFDVQGRKLRTLVVGDRPAGRGSVTWDGRRDDGTRAAPGVYVIRLAGPGMAAPRVRRVTLVR